MRVIEQADDPEMTKKKRHLKERQLSEGSQQPQTEASSIISPQCPHLSSLKSVTQFKKALFPSGKNNTRKLGACDKCSSHKPTVGSMENSTPATVTSEAVWICLHCGHQGCSRYSEHKHALTHFQAERTGAKHSIAADLSSLNVWCYECDFQVSSAHALVSPLLEVLRKAMPPLYYKDIENNDVAKPHANRVVKAVPQAVEKTEVKSKQNRSNQEESPKTVAAVGGSIRGLSNLGNTCFFNACLQNLLQTRLLTAIFRSDQFSKDFAQTTHLAPEEFANGFRQDGFVQPLSKLELAFSGASRGPLTCSFAHLLNQVKAGGKAVLSPTVLFGQVCKKAPRFKGFQQQDSQELLCYLLEGLRCEERAWIEAAVAKALSVSHGITPGSDDFKRLGKLYAKACEKELSVVDKIFGGEIISFVHCLSCDAISRTVESFLDLSLPIVDSKHVTLHQEETNAGVSGEQTKAANVTLSKHQMKKARKIDAKNARKKVHSSNHTSNALTRSGELSNDSASAPGDTAVVAECNAVGALESEEANGSTCDNDEKCDELKTPAEDSEAGISSSSVEDLNGNDLRFLADEKGDVEAQFLLGQLYLTGGRGVEQNDELAHHYFGLASDSGNSDALAYLGKMYLEGNTFVKADKMAASAYLKRAAAKGNPKCQELLDSTLLQGYDVDIDHAAREICLGMSSPHSKSPDADQEAKTDQNLELATAQNDADSEPQTLNIIVPEDNTVSLTDGNEGNPEDPQASDAARIPVTSPEFAATSVGGEIATASVDEAMEVLSPTDSTQWHTDCSLGTCLADFTATDLLCGNNQFGCENCAKLDLSAGILHENANDKKPKVKYVDAQKKVLILSPPAVLTLHLKRFKQVGLGRSVKLKQHIEFAPMLDIAHYVSKSAKHVQEGETRLLYSLFGVVEHSGSLNNGHYVAYVRLRPENVPAVRKLVAEYLPSFSPDFLLSQHKDVATKAEDGLNATSIGSSLDASGQWYYVSDSHVSPVTIQKVLGAEAYLLFYERYLA